MNFRTYLQQVYKKWKSFYYFCILFISGTLISAFIIGQTVTPFYIFSMYSYVFPVRTNMSSFKLIINDKEFNTFNLLKAKGDIIRGNTTRFIYLKTHDYKDKYYDKLKNKIGNKLPSIIYEKIFHYNGIDADFISWLKIYFEQEINIKIKSIEIYSIEFQLNNKFKPEAKNKVLIANYKFDG